jgi:ATP/maltotriose-dependent transcriptional regulator MalT
MIVLIGRISSLRKVRVRAKTAYTISKSCWLIDAIVLLCTSTITIRNPHITIFIIYGHRYAEAEELYRQAFEARLRVEGEKKRGPWASLHSLASCVNFSQKLPAKAEPLYMELLEKLRPLLGDEHPDIQAALDGLAGCLQILGGHT